MPGGRRSDPYAVPAVTSSELFVITLFRIRLPLPLLTQMPCWPAWSIVFPVTVLLFEDLFAWSAVGDHSRMSMPSPPVLEIVHPLTALPLEARNSIPVPATPSITHSRTVLLTAVQPRFLPSKMMPRPRDQLTFTFSTSELLPLSESRASLVVRGVPR